MFDHSSSHDDFLNRMLTGLDRRTDRLKDRELGLIGPSLREAFAATGCTEHVNPASADHPGYIPGDNSIEYTMHDLRERERLIIDRFHEGCHAIQWSKAAALHAAPHNAKTTIILSPYDYILSMVLAEKDANAKHPWLASLALKDCGKVKQASEKYALSVTDFRALRKKEKTIHKTLVEAARHVLDKKSVWGGKPTYHGQQTPVIDYYITRYLQYYADAIRERGAASFTVAKMSDKDVLAIGGAFGPNSFTGENGELLRDFLELPLSAEHRRQIVALNAALGITDDSKLPLLEDALRGQGYTPESFIASSRTANTSRPAPALLL